MLFQLPLIAAYQVPRRRETGSGRPYYKDVEKSLTFGRKKSTKRVHSELKRSRHPGGAFSFLSSNIPPAANVASRRREPCGRGCEPGQLTSRENELDEVLSERQIGFVREYLQDFDPQAAAIRAGYTRKGALATGRRLLRQQAIRKALRDEGDHAPSPLAPVVRELTAIATDREGTAPRERLKALELLGRSLGLFKEQPGALEQDLVERILQARRRVTELQNAEGDPDSMLKDGAIR